MEEKWALIDIITLENGIPFHSKVIGLPYFYRVRLEDATEIETASPETKTSVH